jgi:hypothetical protein
MTALIGQLVRDLLAGDLQSYPERTSALDETGWNAFGEIVGAAFYQAVERRFGTDKSDTPVAIDVAAAEALVRSVLGDEATVGAVLEELDEPDLARIELVLLRKLLDDGGPDGESVDSVVSSAQNEAAQFSGEAGTQS